MFRVVPCVRLADPALVCRMFTPEVGGVLNRTVHLYAYADMNERERTRKDMLNRAQWTEFLNRGRPFVIGPQVTAPPAVPTAHAHL